MKTTVALFATRDWGTWGEREGKEEAELGLQMSTFSLLVHTFNTQNREAEKRSLQRAWPGGP